ncbi:hypothetical protein Godav_006359 [Gossypium davidsonii]|uniref:Uncharacterized protein n=1 Tax=Gossypium davidsonii TaxID=34287 RepID=A0A7J8S514_GOSDV|nr:hypothetical protein [Gossypium davidsonii]
MNGYTMATLMSYLSLLHI